MFVTYSIAFISLLFIVLTILGAIGVRMLLLVPVFTQLVFSLFLALVLGLGLIG